MHQPSRLASGLWICALLIAAPVARAQSEANHDLQRASALITRGRLGEAERILVGLAEFEPKSRSIWYQLALSRQLQGKNELAMSPVRRALAIDEKFVPAQLLALRVEVAIEPNHARSRIERIVTIDGENADTLFTLSRIALRDLRANRLAGSLLQRAQAIRPDSTEGLQLQAELLIAESQQRAALSIYERLIQRSPRNPELHQARVVLLATLGRTEETVTACEELLAVKPSCLETRARLIKLLRKLGAKPERIDLHETYLAYYRRAMAAREASRRRASEANQPPAPPAPSRGR